MYLRNFSDSFLTAFSEVQVIIGGYFFSQLLDT